jgi:hypothetical protein
MFVNFKFTQIAAWAIVLSGALANAQDTPSLGDLARQQRAKKEPSKAAQTKDSKPARVYTNEDLPQAASAVAPSAAAPSTAKDTNQAVNDKDTNQTNSSSSAGKGTKQSADDWKAEIENQKGQLASLQKQIDELNASILFAPSNCVEGCVQWNQHQQENQQEVERMRGQLEELKKNLEQMQESARSQGYGSSVWDP